MAKIASVRNFQCFGFRGPHETERVASDINVTDRLCDLRHMARNALAASAIPRVVRVLFYARGVRPVLRVGDVARQAKSAAPFTHNSRILRTVRIVATETGNAPRVHETLNEIVALHAILMGGSIGEVRESCLTELVLSAARRPLW